MKTQQQMKAVLQSRNERAQVEDSPSGRAETGTDEDYENFRRNCTCTDWRKPSLNCVYHNQEWIDAPQDRKHELSGLGLKAGATFIPSLDGFAISENDLKALISERDQYKAHAESQSHRGDRLAQALRKIAEREWDGEEKTWRTEAVEMQDEARTAIAAWEEGR